jgi:exosortase/archaeosortase family protein
VTAGPAAPPRGAAVRSLPGAPRLAAAALIAVAAATALAAQSWYRGIEAIAAAWIVHAVLGYAVISVRDTHTFFFGFHQGRRTVYLGLEVSLACSSVLLVVPAALVTAVLAVVSRLRMSRLLGALAAVTVLVVATNLLRLLLIAVLVDAWGVQVGFGWAHTFFGSLLTLAGMSAAPVLYYRMVRRSGPSRT